MYFKQFLHDETGCASYFLASRQSREAAVVDPQLDIKPYLDLAHEREYSITDVVDTHLHADHISGNRALSAATGARLWLHESADVRFPFQKLHDGQELHLGQLIITVVHTPGHRPESVCLLVTNPPRSPEPSIILSGDTLFVGDVGRPDFGGPEGARAQYESISHLLQLADYLEVFPAHFEGSCGKGMCGRPSTTIGFERRFNPVLQLSPEDFLHTAEDTPARPLNMSAILATNRGEADYAWAMPHDRLDVRDIDPGAAPAWLRQSEALVLDVREPAEYTAGHIPGARSIPQSDLATQLESIPRDRELLVVCQGGTRSVRAARFLKQVGYTQVTNLAGGTTAWRAAGNPIEA
ncbi:MAG TPA: MBL fold metallo-hydrolase [Chloroflexota bacterium]|jgi:glyoxylase-like metal-dependent hydrolase (beta-lactamase superfamily II)/rhodanese-related sulfurtransferase